jgi:hypothetical protein
VYGETVQGRIDHGDQIYVFQADGNGLRAAGVNPIANATNMISALTMGDRLGLDDGFGGATPGFGRNLGTFTTGEVPNGQVSEGPFTINTNTYGLPYALDTGSNDGTTVNDNSAFDLSPGSATGDRLYNGTFGLLSSPTMIAMQAAGASKADWLALLSDSTNWGVRANLAFAPFNFGMTPEPSRALLLALGLTGLFTRRRR